MLKNMDQKKKNLLVGALGVIIFLVVYFLGYQNFTEKNDQISSDLETRSAYLQGLKVYNDNLLVYEKGIAFSKESINGMLARLPINVAEEDFLMYMQEINEAVGGDLSTISFAEPEMLQQFDCLINDETKNVSGYRVGVSTSGSMTYPQFKEYLQYMYEKTQNITFLDSVSISYNASEAKLDGVFNVYKYYIDYDGATYVPVTLPDVPIGVEDPFATNSELPE